MMPQSIWLPTSNDLRRQCSTKLLEVEKDYWLTTNEMLHGMLESIWDAAKQGQPITLQRGSERVTLSPQEVATPEGDADVGGSGNAD